MTFKVLVSAPPILPHIEDYKDLCMQKGVELFTPEFEVTESLNEEELITLLKDADGILCGDDDLNAEVLNKSKNLKVISKWGTGIDSIDSIVAKKLKIRVLKVVDVFAAPLSDSVLAYILMISRKINEKDFVVRNDNWSKIPSFTLSERSLGIVGLGHIGSELARKASALGMRVSYFDIRDIESNIPNVQSVSFETLLKDSDFISIHCDLNKTSKHMFSNNEFNLMKEDSILINTARGTIIKEEHLIIALDEKKIGGACLDVFEEEPLSNDSPLKKFENVYLSPHNSNASPTVFRKVHLKSIKNIFTGLGIS